MYVVIGVDPAKTRLHAVIWDGTRFKLESRTMPDDIVLCAVAAHTWLRRLVRETSERYLKPVTIVIAIEEPVLGSHNRRGANATIPNAKIHGALLAAGGLLKTQGVVVIPANNSRWKKQIVGNGNASKDQITAFVKKTWPRLYREAKGVQDWMDASCIAQYGMYVIKLRGKMAATRRRLNGEK